MAEENDHVAPPRDVCCRNAILCGELDRLCLLCGRSLAGAEALRSHLRDERHRYALAGNRHLDKYPGERIRKHSDMPEEMRLEATELTVTACERFAHNNELAARMIKEAMVLRFSALKNLYYCEICNVTITNAARVQIHISSEQHRVQKSSPQDQTEAASHVTRSAGGGVVAFGTLLVGDKAWNGIVGRSCVLCDVDTEDWSAHVKTNQHLVNLIRLKTCTGSKNFYRKINKDLVHCLTCNQAVLTSVKHFESDEHRQLYNECKKAKNKGDEQEMSNLEKEFEKVVGKDLFTVEESENKEVEKLCKDSIIVNKETDKEEKTQKVKCVKTANDSAQAINDSELDLPIKGDVKVYATENHITYKKKSSFCRACKLDLSSTLARLQEHVSGKKHKTSVAKMGDESKKIPSAVPYIPLGKALQPLRTPETDSVPPSMNSRKYIRSGVQVFEPGKMVINESICIEMYSFQFFLQSGDGLVCLICGMETHDTGHVNTDRHITRVLNADVLIIDTEFVRAVPAGYHCGFCHELGRSWADMEQHLRSPRHERSKAKCALDLRKYLPVVEKHLRARNPWDGPLSGTSIHGGIYLAM